MSSVHDYNRAEVPGRSARASSTRGVRKAFSWQAVSWTWPEQPAAADALRAGYTPHTNLPHGLEVWRYRLFLTVPRRKAGVPATLGYVTVHTACAHRYYLRRDDFDATSFFASIAVDVEAGHCGEAFAYLPDLGSSALVVFSLSDRSSRRLRHNFFRMDPLYGDFDIAGFNYQLADGIFSVALSAPDPEDDGYRTAFFHALCSSREFAVSSRWLRKSTAAGTTSWFRSFQPVGSRGDSGQSTGSFLDERTGVLFMMEVLNHRVTCWNTRSGLPMDAETIGVVAEDDGTSFIYPSDVKVDASRNELWFLTNVYPVLLLGRINTTEYNYHVFTGAVDDVVRDTPCEPARDATGSGHWRRYQAEAASPVSPSLVMEAAGPQ
ncbi:protein yellow-like [Schistocerca serialis cubense]|uniref:protein yellow-like n=1 Tax=Schistocerca serialis cubense TaxID=2023355 RepID=UPI00214EC1ED|nr:protein yellow-like [Schistocerca serialis cubense]